MVTLLNGTVALAAANGNAAANLAVVVGTGAVLAINSSQQLARLALTGGNVNVAAGGAKVLDLGVLEFTSPASRLDLADNDMILRNTSVAAVEGFIRSAYNFSAWDGNGLRTSMPDAAAGLTTLAVSTAADAFGMNATDTGTWNGQPITGATVIVKYTYGGDVNFDGMIDASDYGIIDNYFQFPGSTGYANGDFNFDGVIDAGDYGIIDNSMQMQGTPL
jgi:hypothetical protein